MKILDRYIGKQVIITISLVTFALLGVDMFFYLVNELRAVGKGDYTYKVIFIYILLAIPRRLYLIFPWASLLGSLLALGNLGKYSELVAMRVAAVSVPRIAWSAIKAGLLLTIIMFICGEVVSPHTDAWAQSRKTAALSRGQAINTQFGTWVRHNNEFIHVGAMQDGSEFSNITRYDFDDNLKLLEVEHADQAIKHANHWQLQNVLGTVFNAEEVTVTDNDEKQINELLDTEILKASSVKHLECLSLTKLWRVIKSRVAQELSATEYERAFWLKMVQPFVALVMIFLAVPFAFGPLRSASMGLKILVGVLVGFSFHTLNSIFGPLTAVIGMSPMLAAMIPATVYFTIGSLLVLRVR